ncbi:hypothetical protein RCG17_07820 [Neobacillus sp. PS3-12]|uniref:hypothetical protein n=1 Tax=Neobacillus sp. PS3-12 TaxID=3070677 RepID=UPI0027E1862E|nr:hypothetical protein [Neobacillus sp. PS3-12]WML54502.1 hypothetical protein RCG17_07820 [Neobacillus sp. PS3-12]
MKHKKNQVKLRTKINLLILLNLLFVLLLFIVSLSFIMVHREYDETGQTALAVAKTVAELPGNCSGLPKTRSFFTNSTYCRRYSKKSGSPVHCHFQYEFNSLQPS